MKKIKTRERVRDIKVLDKAAVARERMKASFIRSRETARDLNKNEAESFEEYAENSVQSIQEGAINDTGYALKAGIQKAIQQTKDKTKNPNRQTVTFDGIEQSDSNMNSPIITNHYKATHQSAVSNVTESQKYNPFFEKGRALAVTRTTKLQAEKTRLYKENGIKDASFYAQSEPYVEPRYSVYKHSQIRKAERNVRDAETDVYKKSDLIKNNVIEKNTIKHGKNNNIKKSAEHIKSRSKISEIKTPEYCANAAEYAKASAKAQQQAAKTSQTIAKTAAVTAKNTKRVIGFAAKAIADAAKAIAAIIAAGGGIVILIVVIICIIGVLLGSGYGIFFSGEDTGSEHTLREAIAEINTEFSGEIETIKSENPYDEISVSGSPPSWKDVLAVYAVKTTMGEENGQEVVTMTDEKKQILKEVFWSMTEINYYTETHYVGDDDIEIWLYIDISHKTAEEAAEMYEFNEEQLKIMREILSAEYAELWTSVLYGAYSGDGAIISVAHDQLGNVGGEPYWRWYGFNHRVEWCACFVSWCANECGYIESGKVPKFSSCGWGVKWFKEHGQWIDGGVEPAPGMIIFFAWTGDGWSNHVGIVERVENGRVYTIEGNSGDVCRQDDYSIDYECILGYGIIKN